MLNEDELKRIDYVESELAIPKLKHSYWLQKYLAREKLLFRRAVMVMMAVGLSVVSIHSNPAIGQTAITGNTTVTATNTNGLSVASGVNALTITFDPNGGAITIGADSAAAVTSSTSNTVTLNAIGNAGNAAKTTVFAGDVITAGGGTVAIIVGKAGENENATLELQGNVTETSGTITIVVGDGSNETNDGANLIIDSKNDENLVIASKIDGDGAGNDTATLAVTDSEANTAADSITFSDSIGAANALDAITVGSSTESGEAIFQGTVAATSITVDGGDNSNETGLVEFQNTVTGATLTLDNNSGAVTATFNSTNGAFSFVQSGLGNFIDGGDAGEGTLIVIDDDGATTSGNQPFDVNADRVIFNNTNIGASRRLGAILVGSSTLPGNAQFQGSVAATTVTVTGGDAVSEFGFAEFFNLVTATSITLDDNTERALVIFNATFDSGRSGAFTITGTVDGGASGEGAFLIYDADSGESDAVTFASNVGASAPLKNVIIGDFNGEIEEISVPGNRVFLFDNEGNGGDAIFSGTFAAGTVRIEAGDAAGENAGAVFVGDATITTLALNASATDATTDATAEFQSALTATTVTLDDAASNGTAELTINTTNGAQTIAGTIDGGAAGEGTLLVFDEDNGNSDLATFSGNVGATNSLAAVTIGTANTVAGSATFQGSLSATTITANGGNNNDDDTAVTATGTVTATTLQINATTANNSATTTFTASGNVTVPTINVVGGTTNAGATATLNVGGDISATTITLDDNTGTPASLVLNGTAGAQTVTGAIVGAAAGDGFVNVTNTSGVVTFASAIGATTIEDITLAANVSATFNSTVAISDDFTVAAGTGTITVNDTITIGDTLSIGAGVTITLTSNFVSDDVLFSHSIGAAILGGAVTVNMPQNFTSGVITLANDTTDGNAAAADIGKIIFNSSVLATYTAAPDGGGDDILVTATKKSLETIAAEIGVSESAAAALDAGVTAAAGDAVVLTAFNNALAAGGAEATKTAKQMEPAQTGGASAAMGGNTTTVSNIVSSRLDSVRDSGTAFASHGLSGFSAGEGALSKSAWLRPFGSTADQDNRKDADGGPIDGFDAITTGIAAGIDGMVSERTRLGVSFTYSNTDVDGDGIQDDKTEIDAYQFTLYGDYSTDKFYIEGMLGYAFNDVETSRKINFGGLNLVARGSYDADQYTARIGGGIPLTKGRSVFTPHAAFQYSHLDNETFTETGAGVLNLVVDPEDLEMAIAILGLKYQSSYDVKNGVLTPQIRTSVSYDLASDEADSVSRFTNSTTTFTTRGADIAEFGGNVGTGLTFTTVDGRWDLSADYDADIKADYLGHTGRLEARYNF